VVRVGGLIVIPERTAFLEAPEHTSALAAATRP